MPLPVDATLTLQGQPRPGDPLHSKPKQAMIFRMSAETFEQLEDAQNLPKLQFEFGKTPGLYINDTFYPVRHDQENGPHELYLRMASAQKPMAPLKLYANVIGKFMVERQLGEKVEGTVRDRTLEAEKLRTERKAIYLETPPNLNYPGAKAKGRKDAPPLRRPAVASATSSARASRVASPLPGSSSHANGSTNEVPPTKARLIHCLALKPRTAEGVITMCAGRDPTPQMKKELISLLHTVAEPKPVAKNSDPDAPQYWQLKLESWLDVRPYEWPSLTPEERTSMSRQARTAYKNLKIPESDPVWGHARYREVGSSDAGPGSSAKPVAGPSVSGPEPKKGVVAKSANKKAKAADGGRKKASDIIIAKDESARPPRDDPGGKGKARERDLDEGSGAGTPTSATRPAMRRLPGSGYKVKASVTPPATDSRARSPLPPPPKKSGPVDAREARRERELPPPSGSAKPLPPIAPPVTEQKASVSGSTPQFRKKAKETPSERAAEDRREERQRERERQNAVDERQRTKGQASPVPASALSFKRKKAAQDALDSELSDSAAPLSVNASKKRRLEESAAEKSRNRDLSLPKKPVPYSQEPLAAPRMKVKKEPSPLSIAFSPPPSAASRSSLPPRPSVPEKPEPPSSSSSSTKDEGPHRASSSSKRRLSRSHIYTSSEDESDPRPRLRAAARALEEEPATKKHKAKQTPRFKPRVPLPTDRGGLRSYYKSCFLVYIRLYQEQAQRRDRIERMLEGDDRDDASGDDADGDLDDLDPDVLVAFMAELKAVTEEMNKIRQAWERMGGSVDSSGELVDE
ncbi:hypothetical protein BV20DRAFT_1118773 [Pilatotrama ljubarskyi]|nr:hypothetical protein BV20DRAFT_1118773 [Pilatotrama ljubarskyi]